MREQANAARLSIGSMVSPPTDNIPSPRKRADFPQVFRHERTLANRLRETSRSEAARGRNSGAPRYRQAKATKCGEKTVRRSQGLIVPWKQGNQPEGPWGGKEASSHERWSGNGPGTLRPQPCYRNDPDRAGSDMR